MTGDGFDAVVADLVQLPASDEAHVVTTTYTWSDGYRPTVVSDVARRGLTGQYTLTHVDIVEYADLVPGSDWHRHDVNMYGWPVKADGSIITTGQPRRCDNGTVARSLWRQHKGLD